MKQDEVIRLMWFDPQKLDYIIENNLAFSFDFKRTSATLIHFQKSIEYLLSRNFNFESKKITINLNHEDNYLNREQLIELKSCETVISKNGGKLSINDGSATEWSLDNVIFANNRIDSAIELINSMHVPDEDNRPLNDLEKLMFAYNICRSLHYNENTNNPMNARTITAILNDGSDIVCVGYAALFNELCTRLGIKSYYHYCKVDDNNDEREHGDHINNIVVLDKKIFYNDVCWDSATKGEIFDKYNFFMLPYVDKLKIKNSIVTEQVTYTTPCPFVNILEDKETIKLVLSLPDSRALDLDLKNKLNNIYLKYSNIFYDLDYFDYSFPDSDIKRICRSLLENLEEYKVDCSIPLELLEQSLYNLNRACGASIKDSEEIVNQTINFNISRSSEIFTNNAMNAFSKECIYRQNTKKL